MVSASLIFSALALLASQAAAHGGVGKYIIGSTEYKGWEPYNSATGQSTIQRKYSSYDPILTPTGTNIRCNNAGETSQLSATIAAGTDITAVWTQWTHAEGPVTVYMAKCPASCADFDGSGAVWFKIDEAGLLSGTINKGEWGNGIILKTLKWTTTIPASLTPGNYIIRHEVLALHQELTPQFYPECAQLTVTGSGTASPSGSYLVSLPGAFSMSDPGVSVRITSDTSTTYIVPGPAVWPGTGSGTGTTPVVTSAVSSAAPAASTSSVASVVTSAAPASTGAAVAKFGQW
ncbi:uncharacterized protein H6S33_012165 [Morchella sextelata]|uniref:uncharacterized protein n=1 Tax=Morchella sextelata TaxID=1174677 RepID=UPI001D037543|nr:uncharacterized protein H6S33_012165 [Morchella sextelata]KAH0610638.1 hypothetical protein H6S33_012165 [Morchella sextelata]